MHCPFEWAVQPEYLAVLGGMARVLLNLGCGLISPEAWDNRDASWHLYLAKHPVLDGVLHKVGLTSRSRWAANVTYMNLNRNWDLRDDSVDVVYAHHVFEHLSPSSARLFLREAARVLHKTGVLRLVVPDLAQHAERYLSRISSDGALAAADFLTAINLQVPLHPNPLRRTYESLNGYPSMHKTMYDEPSLSEMLLQGGFHSIVRETRGRSARIPEIGDVEQGDYACSLYLEGQPS